MNRRQQQMLIRICLALPLLGGVILTEQYGVWQLVLFLVAYGLIGWDILWKAARNIIRGRVFDENFLMTIASIGAACLGEYSEGLAVMIFYQIGELFQSCSVSRSRRLISDLMDIRPDHANRMVDGTMQSVDPGTVAIGELIAVKPGERVPLDGVVTEGDSWLDASALTGESRPKRATVGDSVVSGCVNQTGLLLLKTTKAYEDSTVSRLLELVENSSSKKAKTENFITKFARFYTPIVVIAAALLALIPPLLFGGIWADWIERALIFLVISCPCALVISIPMSFFGGIGAASKNGILVKGGNYLEALSKVKTVVFDKTGTLTKGTFVVTAIHPSEFSQERLLEFAAYAEGCSDHPIAASIRQEYAKPLELERVTEAKEIAGFGVRAVIDGHTVLAGSGKWMEQMGLPWKQCHCVGTIVHIAVDGKYQGHIVISDEIKPDAKMTIVGLKKQGINQTVMLTGDAASVGEEVAKALSIDKVYAELLPEDKVCRVEELFAQQKGSEKLAFVGDGMNDAPVLSRADVGIAMGGIGSDAAIEAADVVLMEDKPSKLLTAIRISHKTNRIVWQNIIFALGVKALILILGAFGIANMWGAVFADVGVSILAILNTFRLLVSKNI